MLDRLKIRFQNLDPVFKKVILGFLILGIILIFTFLIIFLFFKPFLPPPKAPETIQEQLGFPEIQPGEIPKQITKQEFPEIEQKPEKEEIKQTLKELKPKLKIEKKAKGGLTLTTAITDYSFNAKNLSYSKEGNLRFYNEQDNKFYKYNPVTKKLELLSDETFENLKNFVWSPVKDQAILEFPDETKIFYDFKTGKKRTLPKEAKDFAFSYDGTKISWKAVTLDPSANWIVVSNPDGTNPIAIEPLGDKDLNVETQWDPTGRIAAIYKQGATLTTQEIFFIGVHGENFKSLKVFGRGFEAKWSASGNRLIYNIYNALNNYRPRLWAVYAGDSIGIDNKDLGLNTWVKKCVFDKDEIWVYCGVPLGLKPGAAINPSIAKDTPDILYKINLDTGFKQVIAKPFNGISLIQINNPQISEDGKTLYFIDGFSGVVSKIELK